MDWNGDGKKDLMGGDTEGNVWFFENIGTDKEPRLAAGVKLEAGGKTITGTQPKFEKGDDGNFRQVGNKDAVMGVYSKIHFTDWDGDGLLDLLIGQDPPSPDGAQLLFYRNIGTAKAPKLAAPVSLNILKKPLSRPSPYVVDWDGDGKRDLLLGTDGPQVMFLRNIGTNEKPEFADPEPIELKGIPQGTYRYRISVSDWNNDGKPDLLIGNFYSGKDREGYGGNVWLFLRK